jgi:hypothetical protein
LASILKDTSMKTSKQESNIWNQSRPAIQPPTWEPTLEQISRRPRALCAARGGTEGVALNDWLQAEQELKREFEQ